jgi:uroporphyrin-III C-methyltransferase
MNNPISNVELILIGAGPGDPGLLTVKAWHAIQKADTILYDQLVGKAVLELAPANCKLLYVGKKPYEYSVSQEEIHDLIAREAALLSRKAEALPSPGRSRGRTIIRLKGGDPFIFGRGFEEVLAARELGLKVTYIPGISSMQTAGLASIPLTHRAVSEGIWILTGTKKDGALAADLRLAMKSRSTVVIYMGMKKLAEIAAAYRENGLGETPAAIIRHGSLPHQQMALGVAAALPAMAEQYRLTHPAIILIGDVVSLHDAQQPDPNSNLHDTQSPDLEVLSPRHAKTRP